MSLKVREEALNFTLSKPMCKYKLQEIFLTKTQYQEYYFIECFETSRKLHKSKLEKINNKKKLGIYFLKRRGGTDFEKQITNNSKK